MRRPSAERAAPAQIDFPIDKERVPRTPRATSPGSEQSRSLAAGSGLDWARSLGARFAYAPATRRQKRRLRFMGPLPAASQFEAQPHRSLLWWFEGAVAPLPRAPDWPRSCGAATAQSGYTREIPASQQIVP